MKFFRAAGRLGIVFKLFFAFNSFSSEEVNLSYERPGPWKSEVGQGFRAGAMEASVSAGAGFGMRILFSETAHDWALGAVDVGWVFTDVVADDKWYRGNWELLGEVFGGAQFRPDVAYVVGVTPLVRYNFMTGSRFVPFINAGAGATATDIRNGDLSSTFEFNLQSGVGTHWFVRDHVAITAQYRFIHLSNAGTKFPNLGINTSTFLFGASWFF